MRRLGPALGERDFKLWWLALLGMGLSLQMLEVAIGWEVYAQHRSALDLGWIGLAEFVPLFVLALPAGQLADVLPRRLIFAGSLLLGVGIGVGLALVSASGDTSVIPYLALAVGAGIAMALGTPAARAMPPTLVGPELLQSAMTLRSIATQSAQVVGPAIGGLLGAAVVTRRPIGRRAGRVLLNVVFLYGASIVVFGLSRSYPLSLLALGVSGFVDLYSMNIRSTTVALATPDRLRGRVNAVRDGVHQRFQSARRVRVRAGRLPGGHRAGRRGRRRDDDVDRTQLAALLSGAGRG